ncbi:hypothetical protein F4802DRAFT_592897 [Xylaria palmicola]|nr:hypothetical protein F4802DRAFT_592897 [Xylaria palmicola]
MTMDTLPPELLARIVFFLPIPDLTSMRLVNRQFADIAIRPLFEVLRFSGQKQEAGPSSPWAFKTTGRPGRTRTVEFVTVPEVVDEILGLSLARYAKTFIFDPAYCRERFWRDYLEHIENEMDEQLNEVNFEQNHYPNEDWDDFVGRTQALQWRRLQREAYLVEAAKTKWNETIAEQERKEEAVLAALARLFRAMPALDEIEVKPWVFDIRQRFPYLESRISDMVDGEKRGSFPTAFLVEMVARALHAADRSIKRLRVSAFFAGQFHDTPATQHLFTGLEHIRLERIPAELLADEAEGSQILVEMFKRAQPTLRQLSIASSRIWPQFRSRSAHSLLKMLSDGTDEAPLVYPRLESVELSNMDPSTLALMPFFHAQPALKRLEFKWLNPDTHDGSWPSLAA